MWCSFIVSVPALLFVQSLCTVELYLQQFMSSLLLLVCLATFRSASANRAVSLSLSAAQILIFRFLLGGSEMNRGRENWSPSVTGWCFKGCILSAAERSDWPFGFECVCTCYSAIWIGLFAQRLQDLFTCYDLTNRPPHPPPQTHTYISCAHSVLFVCLP